MYDNRKKGYSKPQFLCLFIAVLDDDDKKEEENEEEEEKEEKEEEKEEDEEEEEDEDENLFVDVLVMFETFIKPDSERAMYAETYQHIEQVLSLTASVCL
ncbi:hypothetical protein PoB_004960500 [Plakobranchus ocellatus]|uniref:Uncharacterized protein n=1 Tax=Plakobranchus ocellatus TaxID=259542 RepID=A0AAV4BVG6_9GAST|nr:hypothetical protein PoB_004960500 [Plakobranchus ocellatus]